MIAFDARLNPGCSEKIERQFALCMLKNIEKNKEKGIWINPEYLKPELYSFQIPNSIVKGLGLKAPGDQSSKGRGGSRLSKRSSVLSSADGRTPNTTKGRRSQPLNFGGPGGN